MVRVKVLHVVERSLVEEVFLMHLGSDFDRHVEFDEDRPYLLLDNVVQVINAELGDIVSCFELRQLVHDDQRGQDRIQVVHAD